MARMIRMAILFGFSLLMLTIPMLTACAPLPWDECGATERAVLAEFPLFENSSAQPEFNPKHTGCVFSYATSGTSEEVLAYFTEQLEAHGWKGVPFFASGAYEIHAYRDHFVYGVTVGEGTLSGQELPAGTNIISIVVEELPEGPIADYEPNANYPRIELTNAELEKFVGEYALDGSVEAVVTLVDGQLHIRRPGRLANRLIPVEPTRFRFENFSDVLSVEFAIGDDEVTSLAIEQNFVRLHSGGGSMPMHVELARLP